MASEKAVLRALDYLTEPQVESLGSEKADAVGGYRAILDGDNTVGVGMGYRMRRGRPTSELVVSFYVRRKRPLSRLRGTEVIPPALHPVLAGSESVGTDVVEVGDVRPEGVNAVNTPVQPGNSIAHGKVSAGTLGAIVARGKDLYLLSNSHVLANSGKGKVGDEILYPASADRGRSPRDVVGTLADFERFTVGGGFVNLADCAIARVDPERVEELRAAIRRLGLPKGVAKPRLDMRVTKTGRTSGTTQGKVIGVSARLQLTYPGVGKVGFRDQVLCTRYSQPGDSGSLVLEKGTLQAVGLHFAGGALGSFFTPIDRVLKALRVKLVTTELNGRARAAG